MRQTDGEQKNLGTLKDLLEKACDGLFFLSETDARVEPFYGPRVDDVTSDSLIKVLGSDVETASIEAVEEREFFEKISAAKSWHTSKQRENAEKFRRLQDILESELNDLRVFKVGRVRLDIFIVGADPEGHITGVRTKAVET